MRKIDLAEIISNLIYRIWQFIEQIINLDKKILNELMSFLKKIFGNGEGVSAETPVAGVSNTIPPLVKEVKFGRYTDCNKTNKQVDYWHSCVNKFKEKAYVDSFEAFLNYVRDEVIDNVKITRNGDSIEFELIQGSKVLRGKGTPDKIWVESPIIQMDAPSIPVMRKLMSINYALLYSKFALKENVLVMKFSSHAIDASPNKLYDAFKELALKADQQDDLLATEFASLKTIDTDHIIQLSPEEKEIKYQALVNWIKETREEIAKFPDPVAMSGGIAFLLLNLSYKIDYLICPQGTLTDSLENIHRMFFAKNDLSTHERNKQIIAEYDKIANSPKEKIESGLYNVKSTFAIAPAVVHKTVMDMMFNERNKVAWYRDNKYPQIVEAIYSYMISYSFFTYGMVYPVTDILNLAMNVLNPDYYAKFGAPKLVNDDKTLDATGIKLELNRLVSKALVEYPYLKMDANNLKFTSKNDFIDSLIVELDKFDLRRN